MRGFFGWFAGRPAPTRCDRTSAGLHRLWLLALVWCGPLLAQPAEYEPGIHYQVLSTPLPDADPDRFEVIELFWYGCPDCYDLLPTLQIWESSYRSSDMTFSRLPVVWNGIMETHARLYLTADELGLLPPADKSSWQVTPTLHNAAFDAIHQQHNPLRTPEEIYPLFEARGISREAFDAAWQSDEISSRLEELKRFPPLSEIPRLPALILDGRYVISYNEAVTDSEDLYKVLNSLVFDLRQ